MNNDEQFENRLRRQPLREIPSAWREEILAATDANRRAAAPPPRSENQTALLAGWRVLLGRFPIAWSALAALWVALIGVNLMMPGTVARVSAHAPQSARLESLAALDFQRAERELFGDQFSPAAEAAPASKTPTVPLRPRSERRRDAGFGETRADDLFETIA